MNKEEIKIKTFGWNDSVLGVLPRINEGLIGLGSILTDENPDLVFKNEDFFDEAIEFVSKCERKPFLILNLLDLQIDNPNYDLVKLKNQLLEADAITCISKTTQSQIKQYLGLDATIIYTPSKETFKIPNSSKTFPFLYVGRANSHNKRFGLIKETIKLAGWNDKFVTICGSEYPFYGNFLGVVDDESLNILYNKAEIVLLPSSTEGIGLSFIEGLQAGTPVIGCSDCAAAIEFLPPDMICEPTPKGILNQIVLIKQNYQYFKELALKYGEKYKIQFSKEQVAKNIIEIYLKSR